jgi:hypothetical protein
VTNTTDRPIIRIKGALVHAQAIGTNVELWFSSPTGDASDSFIHHLPCLSEAQAQSVAEMHKQVWGL